MPPESLLTPVSGLGTAMRKRSISSSAALISALRSSRGPRDTSTALGRFDGFTEELSSAGLALDPSLVVWGSFTHESGYSGLVRLMRQEQPPTAVFCGNDVIANGALDASKKLGLSVPDDVSIIGVDDIPMASWSMIALTTIRQDIMEIGAKAAHRLAFQIEARGDASPTHDILPTSVVRRNTTAPLVS